MLLRAGRATATPLPRWLPSDASSTDRPLGNGSGKSRATTADGLYSFLASELHCLESLSLCPDRGGEAVDWLVGASSQACRSCRRLSDLGAVLDLYMWEVFCAGRLPRRRARWRGDRLWRSLDRKEARFWTRTVGSAVLGLSASARGSKPRRSSFSPACSSTPPSSRNAGAPADRQAGSAAPRPTRPGDMRREPARRACAERTRPGPIALHGRAVSADAAAARLPRRSLPTHCPLAAHPLAAGRPRRRSPAPGRRAHRGLADPARPRRTRAAMEVGPAQLCERADRRGPGRAAPRRQ